MLLLTSAIDRRRCVLTIELNVSANYSDNFDLFLLSSKIGPIFAPMLSYIVWNSIVFCNE